MDAGKKIGLSPLARGTRTGRDMKSIIRRFIPAGAGNTRTSKARTPDTPVYPRWRGEHNNLSFDYPVLHGLSPLARGTPTINGQLLLCMRFIPAGAGNTH